MYVFAAIIAVFPVSIYVAINEPACSEDSVRSVTKV